MAEPVKLQTNKTAATMAVPAKLQMNKTAETMAEILMAAGQPQPLQQLRVAVLRRQLRLRRKKTNHL